MSLLKIKCQEHWKKLGINGEEELRKYIEVIFEKHSHQSDVIEDIYRMVFPEWDRIRRVNGYPEAGSSLWRFICKGFQEFDNKHHPDCLPGGAWMNIGFSSNKNLSPWEISFENCSVEYA